MSLSPIQLLIILGIALLIFGTKKLSNAGRDLGGAVKGFKDAVRDENEAHAQKHQTLEHNEGVPVDDLKVNTTTKSKDTQA